MAEIDQARSDQFVKDLVGVRLEAVASLDSNWAAELASLPDGETPDLRTIAIKAIDTAIGGTMNLVEAKYVDLGELLEPAEEEGQDSDVVGKVYLTGFAEKYFAEVSN